MDELGVTQPRANQGMTIRGSGAHPRALLLLVPSVSLLLQCVLSVYFKDTEPSPLQDSSSVPQKGSLLGPPPRSPASRIHRCPGGLYRGSIAQVGSCPNCFQALASSSGLLQGLIL